MILSAIDRIIPIKKALKFAFSGFGILFVGMLVFLVVHDTLTDESQHPKNIVPNMAF